MSDEKLVTVRVLAARSLSLNGGDGSTNYLAGDELKFPAGEAKQLIADGLLRRFGSGAASARPLPAS
jgi:hypothetical protein